MRNDLPTGTVTFVFTDVEGSTRLLSELGAEAYAEALADHRRVIRKACAAEHGIEVDTQGDAFFFAFASAPGAVAAASSFTGALSSGPVHVRVGLHTGTPLLAEEGYVGHDVHVAARIAAAGHGGQIVVSQATAALLDGAPLVSLGWHRLKDVAESLALYQLGEGDFPPLATIANTNLPTPVSSFVGREAELVAAGVLLQATRLLTITGPGGAGKTRFALELARRTREVRFSDYPGGVFACFLASLREPQLVLATIAQTLSVREQAGESAFEALASHLERKRLLLLLDNLEHLLEASPELAQLLERCPGLTFLVTSRELLRLRGERAYVLPPLVEQESVALFCERAGVEPSLEIEELCRRLEGLPLALELAAARLTILTPAQLFERLSRRLDLLKGMRDSDPRQQTLRATIEWSHDLLSPVEQRLFRALSVFAGGCPLEAAEEVAEADLDTLQSLVDKSLLRYTDGRYWMLETIREYAAEALEQAGEASQFRRAHGDYYLASAEEAGRHLRGPDQDAWMERVEQQGANPAAAAAFFLETDAPASALRIGSALADFWERSGRVTEARALIEEALRHPVPTPDDVRARALHAAGRLAYVHADRGAERALFEQAVELFRRAGDTPGEVFTEVDMAWTALAVGDVETAHAMAESCVARARALEGRYVYAWALRLLGETLIALERFDDSERALGESLAVFEECRDPREQTRGLSCLAWLAIVRGDYERAARLLGDSIARISATDAEVLAIDLNNLGVVKILLGNDAQALGALSESLQLSVPLGSRLLVAESLLGLAVIAARASEPVRAAQLRAASQALHLACESPLNPPEERLEQFLLDELGPAEPRSGDIDLDDASALATEVVTRLEALQPAS